MLPIGHVDSECYLLGMWIVSVTLAGHVLPSNPGSYAYCFSAVEVQGVVYQVSVVTGS